MLTLLLFADVLPDNLLLKPDRRDRIASGPEMFAGEIALLTAELAGDGDRRFALQETNHTADWQFWGYLDQHMDVIGFEITLDNPTVFLESQGVEYLAQSRTDVTV